MVFVARKVVCSHKPILIPEINGLIWCKLNWYKDHKLLHFLQQKFNTIQCKVLLFFHISKKFILRIQSCRPRNRRVLCFCSSCYLSRKRCYISSSFILDPFGIIWITHNVCVCVCVCEREREREKEGERERDLSKAWYEIVMRSMEKPSCK